MINIEDLTENEVMLLKMAFNSLETMLGIQSWYCYTDFSNELFRLKEKLGIVDIVDTF
jgi:hypothetical protein